MFERLKAFFQLQKLWDESSFYSGPLKKAYTAFKPCRYFRKLGDSGAESFRMRVAFRDVQVIKFDMMKLYGINTKEVNRLFGQDNQGLISLALSGSMASTCAYKLVLSKMIGWDVNGRLTQVCRGIGKTFYVFIDSKVWENLNDRNKSFSLLHEIGHIVLGHLDEQYCMAGQDSVLINPEYERQANVYARETSGKKADTKNAEYALLEANDFLKFICEKNEINIEDLDFNLYRVG
ncbi:MAG: hypothetical protein IKO39_01270 [Treponema sp.]|nr:hypothetical protein [Treponema sp.]